MIAVKVVLSQPSLLANPESITKSITDPFCACTTTE